MATPLFLTDEELQQLTGYKYASYQAAYLTEMGIKFYRNRLGAVLVARTAVDGRREDRDDAPFVLHQSR